MANTEYNPMKIDPRNYLTVGDPKGDHIVLRNATMFEGEGYRRVSDAYKFMWEQENDWTPIPGTEWLINPNTDKYLLYYVAGYSSGEVDIALPQWFFNKYLEEHDGQRPIGAWCYDGKNFNGEYVPLSEAIENIKNMVKEAEELIEKKKDLDKRRKQWHSSR